LTATQHNKDAREQAQSAFQKGFELLQQGQCEEADLLFSNAHALDPGNIDTLNLLGIRQYQEQNYPEAIRLLTKANRLSGESAQTLSNLGLVHIAIENFEKALGFFDLALRIDSTTPEIHNNRGNALKGLNKNDAALEAYKSALHLRPNYAEAISNQAVIYLEQKSYPQAIEYFQQATRSNPSLAVAFNGLGNALTEIGQYQSAFQAFEHALQINPNYLDACLNFGNCLKKAKEYQASITCYKHAIGLNPEYSKSYYQLSEVFYDVGDTASAKGNLEKALRLNPKNMGALFSLAIAQIPKVYLNAEEINQSRKDFSEKLNTLANTKLRNENIEEILGCVSRSPFYLAYQTQDNRSLLSQFGNICIELSKPIQAIVEKEKLISSKQNSKIQIGIVSHYFCNHPVWYAITKGWLTQLNPNLFEIHLFNTNGAEDEETELAKVKTASYTNGIHATVDLACHIREKNLAVLIYPEIGMDTVAKALACLRLTPVQVVSWGHPETTGLDTIDYFLSAEDFERAGARNDYSEELITLPMLGTYFGSGDIQAQDINLSSLDINPDLPILLCAGSPSKYLPENDFVLVEIARQLGRCQFIFFNFQNELTAILKDRLFNAFKLSGLNPEDFINFIPFLNKEEFYGLMGKSDLYLDTMGFSGFNTAMQAIACDLPIVSLEGKYMRGRLASAIMRRLKLDTLVAMTNTEYADIVVALIQNRELLESYKTIISESKIHLFNNGKSISALEAFLIKVSKHSD